MLTCFNTYSKWVEDLNTLQSASIRIHQSEMNSVSGKAWNRRSRGVSSGQSFELLGPGSRNVSTDRLSTYEEQSSSSEDISSTLRDSGVGQSSLGRTLSLGKRAGPGHDSSLAQQNLVRLSSVDEDEGEVEISREDADRAFDNDGVGQALRTLEGVDAAMTRSRRTHARLRTNSDEYDEYDDGYRGRGRSRSRPITAPDVSLFSPGGSQSQPIEELLRRDEGSRSRSPSPMARDSLLPEDARRRSGSQTRTANRLSSNSRLSIESRVSLLSLDDVTLGRKDYNLQKVELNFTDSSGEYHNKFNAMLQQKLNAKSSESSLVIDDYLKISEKEWAARYRDAKLGRSRDPSPAPAGLSGHGRSSSAAPSLGSGRNSSSDDAASYTGSVMDEFLLGENYVRPTLLKRWLQTRIFDWPIYSVFLAIGQIIAANSYQIVLLTDSGSGSNSDQAEKIYIIGGIYIVASCLWWTLFRTMKPRYVMSLPFAFYGLAFLLVGLAPFIASAGNGLGRDWARNVATGLYATASASGSLFFALNFGDEGELG